MHTRHIALRLGCAAAAALSIGTLSGCLINSSSNEVFTGTQISNATFSQVEPGVTTRQWVMGTFGEPTTRTTLEDGSEIWKWMYSKVKSSSGSLLFVFGGSSTTSSGGSAYVQMKDGLVTKAWRTE